MLTDFRVESLVKVMPAWTLKAHFTVKKGARLGLSGPSGVGKTTLLRALAGLDWDQTQGRLYLGEREVTTVSVQKREVGWVSQDPLLFQSMNVLENVTFGLRMRGMAQSKSHVLGLQALERLGLKDYARAEVEKLSGGEKQRVAFLRATLPKPQYLLLDEPFSALDQEWRGALRRELRAFHESWPAPLILVSHDEGDLKDIATEQWVLDVSKNGSENSVRECKRH